MQAIMPIEPVTAFVRNPKDVMARIDSDGPMVLSQNGTGALVMMTVAQWNLMARELADYKLRAQAQRNWAAIQAGEPTISLAEIIDDLED